MRATNVALAELFCVIRASAALFAHRRRVTAIRSSRGEASSNKIASDSNATARRCAKGSCGGGGGLCSQFVGLLAQESLPPEDCCGCGCGWDSDCCCCCFSGFGFGDAFGL